MALMCTVFFLFHFFSGGGAMIIDGSNSFLWSSGGVHHVEEEPEKKLPDFPKKDVEVASTADDRESRIQAARERFLARKGKKWAWKDGEVKYTRDDLGLSGILLAGIVTWKDGRVWMSWCLSFPRCHNTNFVLWCYLSLILISCLSQTLQDLAQNPKIWSHTVLLSWLMSGWMHIYFVLMLLVWNIPRKKKEKGRGDRK